MRYLLILLLVALPAAAVTEHPDGSATITKEEQEALAQFMRNQQLKIKLLEEALKKASEPGKCI